ncbi:NAD(P)/FAD-dependent oxidoreductase [Glutamicibacter sp. MNS18]|uniref:FAD-dependent oxidoreductase n=1 Tax=Glutamicibacter sp. MNS18 TaxID=2989817 RepID=UPI0022360877|nr:FAD/NAD(P)-binding protein [Glutamicibacter sp. MNS18]MCW4466794.1 NAD(P)/FAD-dependent oxidoreductase [Glutamicibacter sp. MNS18]
MGGLAAGYRLEREGRQVLLLEETERLGGRSMTVRIAGEAVNLGAMFVYAGTASHDLEVEPGRPCSRSNRLCSGSMPMSAR